MDHPTMKTIQILQNIKKTTTPKVVALKSMRKQNESSTTKLNLSTKASPHRTTADVVSPANEMI